MPERVEVDVIARDQASGVLKGVGGSFTELKSALGLLDTALQAIGKVYEATVGEAMKYADEVRDLSAVSGQSAEETSRFIQVLDDFQLTTDDAMVATRTLTKQGLAPNIETLAELSDKYLALNNIEDRNKLILDNLGRSGLQWVNVLKQGSAAIRERAAATQSGLILDDQQLVTLELLRMQIDDLNDRVTAAKVTLGGGLAGVLTGSTVEITRMAQEIFKAGQGFEFNTNMTLRYTEAQRKAWEEAKNQAAQQWAVANGMDASRLATDRNAISQEQLAEAEKKVWQANLGVMSTIMTVASETDRYTQASEDLRQKQQDLLNQIEDLRAQGFEETSDEMINLQRQYANTGVAVEDLAKQHDQAMNRIMFDLMMARLSADGLTASEMNLALKSGEALGIFDSKTAGIGERMNKFLDDWTAGKYDFSNLTPEMVQTILNGGMPAQFSVLTPLEGGPVNVTPAAGKQHGGPASGWIVAGERGAELVKVPTGSYVYDADKTQSMLRGGGPININISINTPVNVASERQMQDVLSRTLVPVLRRLQADGVI